MTCWLDSRGTLRWIPHFIQRGETVSRSPQRTVPLPLQTGWLGRISSNPHELKTPAATSNPARSSRPAERLFADLSIFSCCGRTARQHLKQLVSQKVPLARPCSPANIQWRAVILMPISISGVTRDSVSSMGRWALPGDGMKQTADSAGSRRGGCLCEQSMTIDGGTAIA